MEGIAQQMGPRNKKESGKWKKQEKRKHQAIQHAFKVNTAKK